MLQPVIGPVGAINDQPTTASFRERPLFLQESVNIVNNSCVNMTNC